MKWASARAVCHAGSATNLSGLGGMSGSASHPDLAATFIQAQSDSPDRMGGAQPMGATAQLPQMTGPSPQLTASQVWQQSTALLATPCAWLLQVSFVFAAIQGRVICAFTVGIPQVAALQSSGLLGGLSQAGMANARRRGMSTPDLTALAQIAQVQQSSTWI